MNSVTYILVENLKFIVKKIIFFCIFRMVSINKLLNLIKNHVIECMYTHLYNPASATGCVGVYRQVCLGIYLPVRFVGRDRLLWSSMVQGTQRFRQVRAASCVIHYVLCGFLYCLRCWWYFEGVAARPYISGGIGLHGKS